MCMCVYVCAYVCMCARVCMYLCACLHVVLDMVGDSSAKRQSQESEGVRG